MIKRTLISSLVATTLSLNTIAAEPYYDNIIKKGEWLHFATSSENNMRYYLDPKTAEYDPVDKIVYVTVLFDARNLTDKKMKRPPIRMSTSILYCGENMIREIGSATMDKNMNLIEKPVLNKNPQKVEFEVGSVSDSLCKKAAESVEDTEDDILSPTQKRLPKIRT